MKCIKRLLFMLLLLYAGHSGFAQGTYDDYDPFILTNLNDTTKLKENPVVASSYHRYWIAGDQNYTDSSTFVWYVENGIFGIYDPLTDIFIESTDNIIGWNNGGYRLELTGHLLNATKNASEIWVRWDDYASEGYVAVYEQSSAGCIEENMIKGFHHTLLPRPEVWFAVDSTEACSYNTYEVEMNFNNLIDNSFPYIVHFTRPDGGGNIVKDTLIVEASDLINNTYTLGLESVFEDLVGIDEHYKITLLDIRDKYGATGLKAPLGAPTQFDEIDLTIYHLPQTGKMNMSK